MADKADRVFKLLGNAPIPDMIQSLAASIAEAQFSLDKYVMRAIKELAAEENKVELPGGKTRTLLELGLLPSFYHFSEVTLNIKMAISSMEGVEYGGSATVMVGMPSLFLGAALNASYSNKYSFSANASSEVNTKIVSIPAPQELKDMLQQYLNENKPRD